ncbi:hypothetical protein [Luteibacter sp.]|uniref:hypothetical protein n=1 Tax=Luteibacter sp. TaxID=1886636 RepID=UPI0025C6DB1D|nr:hypothetical protein [Luteibacter sp.]
MKNEKSLESYAPADYHAVENKVNMRNDHICEDLPGMSILGTPPPKEGVGINPIAKFCVPKEHRATYRRRERVEWM